MSSDTKPKQKLAQIIFKHVRTFSVLLTLNHITELYKKLYKKL